MELKYKDMMKALVAIEDERNIPEEVILEALKEAMAKAYRKDAGIDDLNVVAEINTKKKTIDIFQVYNVVENVEDDELEMDLPTAREYKKDAILGDQIRRQVEITGMSRAAASIAKNVIRQKIRETEKETIYNTYKDQEQEMVIGVVESVKDKFTLVSLDKAQAVLPKSAQIPGEVLREGQNLRVVITKVDKATKGSQVLVSRADAYLVKRLFEKEVPEIANGVVEIKAIARDAGDRTKMAVVSYNSEVDPIGACIGQRGARVQGIIDELHGEKIDIFQWSADITSLVKNALAPAEVELVLPDEDGKGLLVIVDEDQLSLAIGKKGKNARLAVKLTGHKIDIKTREEIEESGRDFDALVEEAKARTEALQKEHERRESLKMSEAEREAADKRAAEQAELEKKIAESKAAVQAAIEAEGDTISEEMQEAVTERIHNDLNTNTIVDENDAEATEPVVEETVTEVVEEPVTEVVEEPVDEVEEEIEEVVEVAKPAKKKVDLEEIASQNTYVSVFEKLADTSKPKQQTKKKNFKKKSDDDSIKTRNEDLLEQLKLKKDIKPVYTEEELEEIERQQELEEESQYDIDYDEYEEYYEDENN